MKKTYLIITIPLILSVSHPLITGFLVRNPFWTTLISIVGYLTVLYLLYQFYIEKKRINKSNDQLASKENQILEDMVSRLMKSTKDKFIFYKHSVDTPFQFISKSVEDILGEIPEDFQIYYKRFKAECLYDGVFERVNEHCKKGIRVPVYEVELITKKGTKILFEVVETPVFDDNKELTHIWGSLQFIESYVEDISLKGSTDPEKFNMLYENVNDAVILMQADRFIDCNSQTLKVFDTSLDQLLMYTPFSKKFSPDVQPSGKSSREEGMRRIELAYQGKTQEFDWLHLKQGGEAFYANVKLIRWIYQKKIFLLVVLKDISYKFDFINKIKEKEELIDLLYNNNTTSIVSFNVENKITSYNSIFSSNFKGDGDIFKKHISEIISDEEFLALIKIASTKPVLKCRIKLFKPVAKIWVNVDVKIVSVLESGQYSGGIILIDELSEVNELKSTLGVQKNTFEEVISNSNDVLYKYDLKQKRYVYLSQSITDLFGYNLLELSSMTDTELKSILHPNVLDKAHIIIAKFFDFRKIKKNNSIEYNIISKSGMIKWVSDSYSILDDENGEPAFVLGILKDLTELKKSEEIIKHKENILAIMTENQDQGITVIVNNKIEFVNSKLIEISGYSKMELLNLESLFIFAVEQERLKNNYLDIVSGNTNTNNFSYWIKKKSGGNILIKNTYYFDLKNPQNRYVITEDITKEKIDKYKESPTLELKRELDIYLESY